MTLRINVVEPGGRAWPAHGPADLGKVGAGQTLDVFGEADRERGVARWAGAIGSAVLRGASVRRR